MNTNNTPVIIEIPQSAHEATKRAFKEVANEVWARLNSAKKNLAEVEAEWNGLKPLLTKLGLNLSQEAQLAPSNGFSKIHPYGKYDPLWSWAKKAEYVLIDEGKALTAQSIIDKLIQKFEPDLNRGLAQNSLPATLSADAKRGKFTKRETSSGNQYNVVNS